MNRNFFWCRTCVVYLIVRPWVIISYILRKLVLFTLENVSGEDLVLFN